MDFLRLLSDDLQALRAETKKKYPVVREAVDRGLEALPALQQRYAQLLRQAPTPPGPGHALFKSEAVLRPFLLACNHTNASHKILILALQSIQRLVSWDAIEQSSVGSILRVLQIQAEKNPHADVQVKLLQTLLQLVTLGFQDQRLETTTTSATAAEATEENALVGSEDLVMQAVWICIHLHGGSSGASSVVGNTAAMTIRQVVSLAFGQVHKSPEAKRVGVLVFQELCFMSREESGVWLKRTATSPMSIALGVELLETILSGHHRLFRDDPEFHAVLKQHVCSLVQSALETGCADSKHGPGGGSGSGGGGGGGGGGGSGGRGGSGGSSGGSSGPTSAAASLAASASSAATALSALGNSSKDSASGVSVPFFPLLVRVMRLASIVLCNFSDVLGDECTTILQSLLEIVATGGYHQPGSAKSPSHAKLTAHEAKSFLHHAGSGSSNLGLSGGSGGSHAQPPVSYVTWPVLLALEVVNRVTLEAPMVAAIAHYAEPMLQALARTVSAVVTTSPPADFRVPGADVLTIAPRCGLEFLNDQDPPALQPFFSAIRVAVTSQSNLIASMFDLSRAILHDDAIESAALARAGVNVIAPFAVHTFNSTMRHCREVELIQISLKSFHVLATVASRLRANITSSGPAATATETSRRMDDVVLACLRALCAFSFPLPESAKGHARGPSAGGGTSSHHSAMGSGPMNGGGGGGSGAVGDDDGGDDNAAEACVVAITWREVHAMKALFSAAHIMEEEMLEGEWSVLLEGFEIIVGLTDTRLKGGQNRLPTKNYRIAAFRVEDEDVEQQLVMLGNSIVELFRDALKLSSTGLRRLTAALRKVCWDQLGLPATTKEHQQGATTPTPTSSSSSSLAQPTRQPSANPSATPAADGDKMELPQLSAAHQMRTYQNFLGVGLSGAGTYLPTFALRMLTQLATNSKRCFEDVINELLAMCLYTLPPSVAPAQYPQLVQFQHFATDNILQLMQSALQNVINSLSPAAKLPSDASLDAIEARSKEPPSEPHVFDQQELFKPLAKLMRSDLKDRALAGILDLLNGCGHLINVGWPLLLGAIQEAGEIGDARTQVVAFKCLRLVVDDLLVSIPRMYLPYCVKCIGRFACCAKDVNISLTAVNELWSVADILGKQRAQAPAANAMPQSQWGCAFAELSEVALDDRTEVRNCAINTLFGTAVTYGVQFDLAEWQLFVDGTVLPLANKLYQGRTMLSQVPGEGGSGGRTSNNPTGGIMMHHSRDSAQKQWDESRVLLLAGISRVLQTNGVVLLSHAAWFAGVWRALLQLVALHSARGMSKEVVLAAVNTLQTLLQVASMADFDQITQSQPVRAGAGMRVVGGALVATGAPAASSVHKRPTTATGAGARDPALWEAAFAQLLRLCDDRAVVVGSAGAGDGSNTNNDWKEEEEQEIASAVVSVLVTLYTQAKEFEFKEERNVIRLLTVFETLVTRHVLENEHDVKAVSNVTTNSLQSRVLNAFEECGSFEAHPVVHTKALDQVVKYVTVSSARDFVFFTRHALMSLAKLYASVSVEAQRERFHAVLTGVQPFLRIQGDSDSGGNSPGKGQSAAQKAAAQQWKHALRVLLVLISHGLAAVRLERASWRLLVDTITQFLSPSTGQLPAFVQGEEDEALVLSVLECLVDSVIALCSGPLGAQFLADAPDQYQAFSDELMGLLCSGVDGREHSKPLIKCCVRQLATLGIQQEDPRLASLAQDYLVRCCNVALQSFAELEGTERTESRSDAPKDASAEVGTRATAIAAARDRVVILLSSTSEVGMSTRSVLEMFASLCSCITSSDLQVRQLIQRLLTHSRIAELCTELLDHTAIATHQPTPNGTTGGSGSRTHSGSLGASRSGGGGGSWSARSG